VQRVTILAILLLIAVAPAAKLSAGDRLSALSRDDSRSGYYVILRRVFHRIFADDIVLSSICADGTGHEEYAAGILRADNGYAAFSAFVSASVWSTEYPRFMVGLRETCHDHATGKEVPCPPQDRRGLPASYRGIKTELKSRRLPEDLAIRISTVWHQRVEEALRAPLLDDWNRGALGGFVRYYFVRSRGGDWTAAVGSNRGEDNDAERMANLVIALQGYALDATSERGLKEVLASVEKKRSN
jgi:hypothetical protein